MVVMLYGIHQGALVVAMEQGLTSLRHRVILRAQSVYKEGCYEPCDVGICFGLHWPGNIILQEYKQHGTPLIIVDYGYVKRGTLMYSKVDEEKYYSFSLNGLNGRSDPMPSPMPPDRWDTLKTPLQPWKTDGKYILVCGQKNHDVAIGNLNPIVWAKQTIARIQSLTTRAVIFRPHPEDPAQKRPIGVPHSEHKTIQEALVDTYAVVAYNSNALVDATIAGVPTFCLGEGSMVQGVTNTDLSLIDTPERPEREQWAYDLAWRQYTINEIREALPWKYIIEKKIPLWEKPVPSIQVKSVTLHTPPVEISETLPDVVSYEARGGLVDLTEDENRQSISTEEKGDMLPPEEFFKKHVSLVSAVTPIVRRGRPAKKANAE